jgi:hypothetical protein
VRYASASLVRLLIKHGAAAFIRTRKDGHFPDLYPIDWLRKYAVEDDPERNAKISAADAKELEIPLAVPGSEERTRIATRLTQLAEAEYAAGRPEVAYQKLRTALNAQSNNRKALEDLPLIAMRAGHLGASVEAADALIAANLGVPATARAWFNKGLACESRPAPPPYFIEYNGQYYCQHSRLHPFLVSWNLEPTKARKNKLVELFEKGLSTCAVDGRSKIYFAIADDEDDGKFGQSQMIYVYHSNGTKFDPESLPWSEPPTLQASYDLGDATITVLTSREHARWPVTVGTETCEAPQKGI